MFNAEEYMEQVTEALKCNFGERVLFVGLQGSYLRGEATENSDIDVVVIIDDLRVEDLSLYKCLISRFEHPEKSCGFICGKNEMKHWNPLEICNFLHGTRNYFGDISDFVPAFTRYDVVNFVKLSVGNLYHEICHRFIHSDFENNKRHLPLAFKSVFFILQSVYYLRTGIFYPTKYALMPVLSGNDRKALENANRLPLIVDYDFEAEFRFLLDWCQGILNSIS